MPNGKTHDRITFILLPFIIFGFLSLLDNVLLTTVGVISYLFASLMFNGDLDMNSRPYNRWWLMKMVWIPYQLMFYHRSYWTHGLIVGTIIRVLYIGLIPLIILLNIYGVETVYDFIITNSNIFLVILLGLEIGNIVHTISDRVF